MLLGLEMVDEDMGEDNMTDLLIGDMFMWPAGSPRASPRRHDDEASREGSPARNAHMNNTGAYTRDDDHHPVTRAPWLRPLLSRLTTTGCSRCML